MLTEQQQAQLDWEKTDGLLPVVVQHAVSGEVLMQQLLRRGEPPVAVPLSAGTAAGRA